MVKNENPGSPRTRHNSRIIAKKYRLDGCRRGLGPHCDNWNLGSDRPGHRKGRQSAGRDSDPTHTSCGWPSSRSRWVRPRRRPSFGGAGSSLARRALRTMTPDMWILTGQCLIGIGRSKSKSRPDGYSSFFFSFESDLPETALNLASGVAPEVATRLRKKKRLRPPSLLCRMSRACFSMTHRGATANRAEFGRICGVSGNWSAAVSQDRETEQPFFIPTKQFTRTHAVEEDCPFHVFRGSSSPIGTEAFLRWRNIEEAVGSLSAR
jgi:hypothetical protein